VAFAAADRGTARLPAELGYFLNLRDDLLTEPPVIRDGRMTVPAGPGFGTEIDPDKLAHYRTDNGRD
jgi:L-Ala-D/L-Glu epimerase